MTAAPPAPEADCALCPRLAGFRATNRAAHPEWWNAPVPSFGALDASLLVVGLAPGLRGANRTGRPFTGDYAGVLLYETLLRFGFAHGVYAARADDGMALAGCRVTNAVRCVPPENRPLPAEAHTCRPFLAAEMEAMPGLRAVLALGVLAHQAVLRAWGVPLARAAFRHGALHVLPGRPLLADSFHVSRYNTNTGRLTEVMFAEVVAALRARLGVG
ncbi:MAG TPA: uracil-DNA glycosylase [Acetobacteraceae bacterium]|nr:uracil-DNA glycosylase [Acetobacteraceae bacterium]